MTRAKRIQAETLRKPGGITLIELLVALSVLAILATIGIPSFQNLIRSNQVSASHNELIAMINFARSEAVRRNRNMVVEFNQVNNGWNAFVIDSDSGGDESDECPTGPGALRCTQNASVLLNRSIQLEFDNRGYVTPFATESFNIQHSECRTPRHRRNITVLGTGHVNSVESECGG